MRRRRLEHLIRRGTVFAPARGVFHVVVLLRHAIFAAIDHDFTTVAQATAYSAMVALFPALIVAAAVVALLPDAAPFRVQMSLFFDHVLPPNVIPVLESYFDAGAGKSPQTARALLSALLVSLTGATAVMSTLMEGFRRAHELPEVPGSFWSRRGRALALVPLSLAPMGVASALVVFGHYITLWTAGLVAPELRTVVYVIAFALRWTMALAGSIGILAVIYHLGTDLSHHMREHLEPWVREPWVVLRGDASWRGSLPGATVATVLWFVATLLFGFYVTRFANYAHVYGSLGAAIALLVWLYLIALSVLVGSEFNAQLAFAQRRAAAAHSVAFQAANPPVPAPKTGSVDPLGPAVANTPISGE